MDKGPVWGGALPFLGLIFFVSEWGEGDLLLIYSEFAFGVIGTPVK